MSRGRTGRQTDAETHRPCAQAMKTFSCKIIKLLAVSTALFLSAHIFVNTPSKRLPTPIPLPEEEYRLISPQTYRYILNQPAACRARSPFLLLLVPVGPQEAAARETIRKTWGAPSQDTLTLFYMGQTEIGDVSSIQDESRKHGDIIQMDFRDSYHNLTIKTVMMMNWVATHCPTASYVMKVDADIFVNVFYLLDWLKSCPHQGFITGSVIRDGRPRRDSNSKWYISEEQYPEDRFPPYVSGAGYVLSADLATRISWASRFVRAIPLEDVYVGLCLHVLGVQPAYSLGLLGFRNLFEVRNLEYNRCSFSKLIIVNGFKPSQLQRAWQDFSEGRTSC